uniref:Uncharacterized protein n=1 Tax=Populus davidiana TaxID=266767 RepID=A0A6M2F671_9ROSI
MHTRLELIGRGRMKRKWWVEKSPFPRKENPNKVTCKTQVALAVSMELYVKPLLPPSLPPFFLLKNLLLSFFFLHNPFKSPPLRAILCLKSNPETIFIQTPHIQGEKERERERER